MGSVLMVGDLHGNSSHAMNLIDVAVARGCSRVFALGDFGAWEHTPDGVRYFDVVGTRARKRGVVVYFLDGNHDKSSLIHERYDAHRDDEGFLICRDNLRYAPRGHRWSWDGTAFAAFGGAYSIDKDWRLLKETMREAKAAARRRIYGSSKRPLTAGSLWFPEEEMTDAEVAELLAADSSPVDVLLTHDKPLDSRPGWNRKYFAACQPNQARLQRVVDALQPKLMLHGHLHYRYTDRISCGEGKWTRVEGLDADPSAASGRDYQSRDSWLALTLPLSED